MMNEQQLRILARLAKSQDGSDFLTQILVPMSEQNYQHILGTSREGRDELVGYGNCLKELIKNFLDYQVKLTTLSNTEGNDWSN